MKSLLDNRLVTFLLSLFLALILWLYVQGELQIRKTIRVQVNYLRTENLVAVGPRIHELKVDIRGPAAAVTGLEGALKHQIDIDLTNRKPGPNFQGNLDFLLSRQLPREVDILSIQPREVRYQIDEYAEKIVPLTANLIAEPAEGYQVSLQEWEPKKIKIGGGKTVLDTISSVSLGDIDLKGAREQIILDKIVQTGSVDYWLVGAGRVHGKIKIDEKIVQGDFKVPIKLEHSDHGFSISPAEIKLVVEGPYGIIHALKSQDFLTYVEGQFLGPGIYRRAIAIKTPKGVKLVDNEPRYFSIRLWKSKKS